MVGKAQDKLSEESRSNCTQGMPQRRDPSFHSELVNLLCGHHPDCPADAMAIFLRREGILSLSPAAEGGDSLDPRCFDIFTSSQDDTEF